MKWLKDEVITTMVFVIIAVLCITVLFSTAKKQYQYDRQKFKETPTITIKITPTNVPTKAPTPTLSTPLTKLLMGGEFKSIMDYRKITNKKSKQYALQQIAFTDSEGLRRVGRYYCIAMGTHYAKYIGQTFIIEFKNVSVDCIVADIKDDKDTVGGIYCKENGSIVEFIIDKEKISEETLRRGTVLKFEGQVQEIMEEDR